MRGSPDINLDITTHNSSQSNRPRFCTLVSPRLFYPSYHLGTDLLDLAYHKNSGSPQVGCTPSLL